MDANREVKAYLTHVTDSDYLTCTPVKSHAGNLAGKSQQDNSRDLVKQHDGVEEREMVWR